MAQTRKSLSVIEYGSDYSSSYTDRSLTDKAYVDAQALNFRPIVSVTGTSKTLALSDSAAE